MSIVSLEKHTEKKNQDREARLRAFSECSTWFPEYEVEPRTRIARFDAKDWEKLEGYFEFFTLKVPYTTHFEAIIALWSHLWDSYGVYVDAKLRSAVTYDVLTEDWEPRQHAFVDALIAGKREEIRRVGEPMGVFEEAQRIMGARNIVNERGPVIKLDGLPEELARAVAGPGAAYSAPAKLGRPRSKRASGQKRTSPARPALKIVR
jgi:hypothetical protein